MICLRKRMRIMKKFKLLLILIGICSITGCFKRDTMDDVSIVTTTYPIQYLVEEIYGYNSDIVSIYPNGVNVDEYTLSNKKIKEYASNDIIVYNGLIPKERNMTVSLVNKNNDLKLIDVAKDKSVVIERDEEELWLCPRNYLMLARNIKNQLIKLTNSTVLIQEIEKNNEDLKFTISKYDAELKLIADTAENKSIIVGNDIFKFLEIYGFEVYSVEDNDLFIQSDYTNAKTNLTSKKNSYIFLLDTDSVSENTQKMVDAGAEIIYINSLITRTDEENTENYTYTDMMDNFIEKLKLEVYN